MDTTVIVLIVVIVVLALAVGGWVLSRQRRSQRLREHYGDEYERSVRETGDRKAAEGALSEREARVRDLDIRELRPDERAGFTDRWEAVQRDFVDDPARALRDADTLVVEIMRARGYPADGDFDRRAEDLSVDHPRVVRHYREARKVRDAHGEVDTERQRHAVTSYRELVAALLGRPTEDHGEAHHRDGQRRDGQRRDEHRVENTRDGQRRDEHAVEDTRDGRATADRTDATAKTEEQTR